MLEEKIVYETIEGERYIENLQITKVDLEGKDSIGKLSKLDSIRNYKEDDFKIIFTKEEGNTYVENIQMLVFMKNKGMSKPVYASTLNIFEIVDAKKYSRKRVWDKIPFICTYTTEDVKKIIFKESELKKIKKFVSKFNYKTCSMLFDEIIISVNRLDGSQFNYKPKTVVRKAGVEVITPIIKNTKVINSLG